MPYISSIIYRLLLHMTLKRNFSILTALLFFAACTSSPFTELNSRDNFQLEEGTSFKIQLNKDSLPVEMDPILIENLGDAAKNYMDDEVEKTLWTGLTKWRKGSSYAPTDMQSAEMLVENLLVNL